MASNVPLTSKAAKAKTYFQQLREAKIRYGEANIRPQDTDAGLLRIVRRNNYNIIADFPPDYAAQLNAWISVLGPIPVRQLPHFKEDMVIIQDDKNQSPQILQSLRPPPGGFSVLSVDFEFHNEFSYDGFICVASVSSLEKTLVVDCLNENRKYATAWLKKMMCGQRTLKVMCGCSNDIFRLQKDWGCFSNGVVDIQDMFAVWKADSFEECLAITRSAIANRLREKKIPSSNSALRKFLTDLQMPGLGFMMDAFFPASDVNKDGIISLADWRARPLHPDLVKYSACDSYFTLHIFYILLKLVGHNGLVRAAKITVSKLLNRSALPRYRCNVTTSPELQWIMEQLLKWRAYLSMNLDKKPDQIIQSKCLPALAQDMSDAPHEDISAIASILEKYKIGDHYQKGAKLLVAYLEPDQSTLERMKNTVCHSCNVLGHVGKFCLEEPDAAKKREVMQRPENEEHKKKQSQRRRTNWCVKRGKDPATTLCPWEK